MFLHNMSKLRHCLYLWKADVPFTLQLMGMSEFNLFNDLLNNKNKLTFIYIRFFTPSLSLFKCMQHLKCTVVTLFTFFVDIYGDSVSLDIPQQGSLRDSLSG